MKRLHVVQWQFSDNLKPDESKLNNVGPIGKIQIFTSQASNLEDFYIEIILEFVV